MPRTALAIGAGLITILLLGGAAQAAPAGCEQAASVGERTVPAGACLEIGPGGEVTGPLTVAGTLLVSGSPDAPVRVEAPIRLSGEATIRHAAFASGADLAVLGVAKQRGDLVLSDASFATRENAAAVTFTDVFRAEIARASFSGPGTGIRAIFAGTGSSLTVSDSVFAGPGAGIAATIGPGQGERISISGSTFRGPASTAESFVDRPALVAIQGGVGDSEGRRPVITLEGNTFEGGDIGLAVSAANYRLLSTGDTFRANGVGVLIGTEGRNAIFDRATFDGTLRWDMILPSTGEATVKDPKKFDSGKVFVTESSTVTLKAGKSRTEITYDYMVQNRGAVAAGAVSVAVLGFSLSASMRALLAKLIFVPLYARLSPDQVLNHEKRQEILQYVQQNPGVHLRRIGHSLAISYGTLTYHLYRLEREGYITWSQEGLFKRYYTSAGRMKEVAKETPMPTALRDLERQIYDTILVHPGSAQSALAAKLGLSRQALHYHIKKLEKSGYITKVAQGRETLIYATRTADAPSAPSDVPANT